MSSPESHEARATPVPPGARRLQRYAFYGVWLFGLPLALSLAAVWLLTPPPGAGDVGSLRIMVAEQRIPATIIFFTLFAAVVWRMRHELPFAAAAGVGGRRDVPLRLRARFDEALGLLDEARRILRLHRKEVEKELTSDERERVRQGLDELEASLHDGVFQPPRFEAAYARADRLVGEHLARWRKGEIREYAESIAIAVGVALLLRAFVVEAFKIPSGSMIPTLMVGDHIFVNKFAYGPLVPWTETRLVTRLPPERGDVIVFKFPEKPEQDFIKRVVAIPGDELVAVDGRPVINGWVVPHCHVGTFVDEGRSSELYVEYLHGRALFALFDNPPSDERCETSRDCSSGLACYAGVCGFSKQGPFTVREREVWVMGDNRNNSHDSRSWRGNLGAGVPFDYIKGRAMFVFATFGASGAFTERLLVDVMGRPQLPASQARLQPALDKCLREMPENTTPPPPAGR